MRYLGFEFIQEIQRRARRVFTVEEAQNYLKLPRKSVIEIIGRLQREKLIVALANGLYALLHPTEKKYGLRPIPVIDALMRYKKSDYYVGLLTAADHWGAAHHKPQVIQMVVPKQMALGRANQLKLQLHVKKKFSKKGIVTAQSPSGYYFISSPELTALDIISFEHSCGGFGNMCIVVRDLMEKLKRESLLAVSQNYNTVSVVQRLGYLLEEYGANPNLIVPLKKYLRQKKVSPVPLTRSMPRRGKVHRDWQVIINEKVEREE